MTFSFLLAFVFRDLKVVILGDSSVGKTTLICRYMEGVFQSKKSVSTSIETNAVYWIALSVLNSHVLPRGPVRIISY